MGHSSMVEGMGRFDTKWGGCFGRVQGGLFLSFGHATPRCTGQEVQHLNV